MGVIKNLEGQVFGKLTVLSFAGLKNKRISQWMCKCECGNYTTVVGAWLTSDNTTSCGCFKIQRIKETKTIHGHNTRELTTPEYAAWYSLKQRCTNKNSRNYKNYAGRGIKVCSRWIDSFENFLADMGCRPSDKHSIDRINNNGDYEPENCRWATKKQQANNVRDNKIIEYKGISKTLSEWHDELGFNYATVSARLRKGYSVEKSFETIPGYLEFKRSNNKPSKESIEKLIERLSKPVLQKDINNVLVCEYTSGTDAYLKTGISGSAINNCINGYSKTAGGLKWERKILK